MKFKTASGRLARLALAGCAFFLLGACVDESPLRLQGGTMGTYYSITVARPTGVDRAQLQRDVQQILAAINAQMSTYVHDSELSNFNRATTTDWHAVSPQLAEVTTAALAISALSGGAFDVTVAPLVRLWGFGAGATATAADTAAPPTAAAIARARARVGHHNLRVRTTPPALRKLRADVSMDLSAIAKGYAVDAIAARLAGMDYLVDIGGEVSTSGTAPGGRPWRIAIEQPRSGARAVHAIITPGDNAVATSGDYRNYHRHGDRRWSHIIDPRSGSPVEHATASVTVVAADAMTADALATALLTMGADAGMDFAERHGVAAYFIRRIGDGDGDDSFATLASSAFALYLSDNNPDGDLASTPFGP